MKEMIEKLNRYFEGYAPPSRGDALRIAEYIEKLEAENTKLKEELELAHEATSASKHETTEVHGGLTIRVVSPDQFSQVFREKDAAVTALNTLISTRHICGMCRFNGGAGQCAPDEHGCCHGEWKGVPEV